MNRRKSLFAVLALLGISTTLLAAEPSKNTSPTLPQLAAYRWGAANKVGGAAANEAYAKWLDLPVVWAEDFEPTERWDSIEGGSWQLSEWSKWKKGAEGRRLILSIPLLPGNWDRKGPKQGEDADKPVSLAAGAKGDYNKRFKKLAENLVKYDLADSILRLGWEFNGGWYAWRAGDDPAAFASYWQQIVRIMRSVRGAEKLQFCFNPASGYQQFAAEKAFPGDEWVDYIGLDLYDDSWLADTYPLPKDAPAEAIERKRAAVWDKVLYNGDRGLIFWRDFAKKHDKPFSIPEWGVNDRPDGHSGLDNATFIDNMHKFITDPANRVAFHCYFDVQAPDGGHQLSPGIHGDEKTHFPNAAARFKELFGGKQK